MIKKFFYHHYFFLQAQVFFPRFETEELVALTLKYSKALLPNPSKVLEIGVGSGVILASLALAFPNWNFSGVDINPKALALSQKNFLFHQLKGDFWKSNLFAQVKGKYHLIVANLPYIDIKEKIWDRAILSWDPVNALFANDQGLALIKRFLFQVGDHLEKPYLIGLEVGINQSKVLTKTIASCLPDSFLFIKKDFNQVKRFIFIYSF